MSDSFRALVIDKVAEDVALSTRMWTVDDLMPGDVTIRVAYSSVNYKDSLAVRADGKVARRYPLVPGIDLAGEVVESSSPRFRAGDLMLAHGYDIGVSHHGGYAEIARLPADWIVPLPAGLTTREAMAIGTAGFAAALSVVRLEDEELRPERGPVLVTGASGGVGSAAVALLAARGYHVVAGTGSASARDYLRELGAADFLDRSESTAPSDRALEKARWAGAIDAVGGPTLAYLLRTMAYGGIIAACGNTGGAQVQTTVFPFILRAVRVIGIDTAYLPLDERIAVWQRLANDLRPPRLEESIAREVSLTEVPAVLEAIHRGQIRGRVIVRVSE